MREIGIILAGGNNHRMKELSSKRAIAAMPVAGSYRSIEQHVQLSCTEGCSADAVQFTVLK